MLSQATHFVIVSLLPYLSHSQHNNLLPFFHSLLSPPTSWPCNNTRNQRQAGRTSISSQDPSSSHQRARAPFPCAPMATFYAGRAQ